MADRTSAGIFGELFTTLSEYKKSKLRDKMVSEVWGMSQYYDFDSCQMDASDALIKLGYAEKVECPDDEDEFYYAYGPEGERDYDY